MYENVSKNDLQLKESKAVFIQLNEQCIYMCWILLLMDDDLLERDDLAYQINNAIEMVNNNAIACKTKHK